ncbi:hypothetical protein DERP_012051 [Dermatophagoides pteronyssinus]|uniref:Uncharacterized protein n=1 Tax=Dermatophagoides pteronyssinus TaxID=6956 RepID=A0ABQ8ITT8_DERPT|nr:hypothetical protein DERP_012051 [Dermatophagoides pteronyssinus]
MFLPLSNHFIVLNNNNNVFLFINRCLGSLFRLLTWSIVKKSIVTTLYTTVFTAIYLNEQKHNNNFIILIIIID